MNNLIQAAEVWVPDADGHLLEFAGGLYQGAAEFGMVSRSMCFGRGEGLPGRVWSEGQPILLKDLQSGYFQRSAAAKRAGLVTAAALPVYLGDMVKAVVVMFCGGPQEGAGAVELWKNDPRITGDMTLVDGYYGSTAAAFEADSRQTYLPRGSGLPGLAWQRESSVFIDGVEGSTKFLRSDAAGAAGIQRGLALPCAVPGNEHYVLGLLSSAALPVARSIESWVSSSGGGYERSYGYSEGQGALPAPLKISATDAEHEAVVAVFASGIPQVRQHGGGLLVLPIISDGAVVEAVALYF